MNPFNQSMQSPRSAAMPAAWRHGLSVFLGFTWLYVLFFAPALWAGKVLAPGDGWAYYLPAFYAPKPIWTDLVAGGYPLMGDPQNMTWYPPARLLAMIPGSWNAFVLLAYVLASSFTYLYVYTLTTSRLGAIVAGLVYGMSGFMMAHLGHTTMIHAAAWIPLIICALERLRSRWTAGWGAIAMGATASSVLAGHPQITVYGLGLSAIYALVLGGTATVGRWRYYGRVVGIMAIGLGLSAIQIVPTIELSQLSNRATMTLAEFSAMSLPREQLLQFLFPYFFGGPFAFAGIAPGPYQLPYWGQWNVAEITGYVGLLPLMLTGLGVIASRQSRPIVNFWLGVGVIAFLLALGGDTVLGHWLYHVPIYNKFRAQGRHFVEVALACSVLSGFGVAAIQARSVSRRLIRRLCAVSVIVMCGGLMLKLWPIATLRAQAAKVGIAFLAVSPWDNPAIGIPLVLLGLSLLALVLWYRWPQRPLLAGMLITVVILNLASFGWFCEWQLLSPPARRLTPNPMVQTYARLLRSQQDRWLTLNALTAAFLQPFLTTADRRQRDAMQDVAVFPNMTRLWGLPSLDTYSPLMLSRFTELTQLSANGDLLNPPLNLADRSFDLMAVRYLLLPHPTTLSLPLFAASPQWRLVEQTPSGLIYQNQRALPRAWLVGETIALAPAQVLTAIHTSQLPDGRVYQPETIALVEDPQAAFNAPPVASNAIATVRNLTDTRVTIQTQSRTATLLVLSDTFYPGWQATIDGKATPIFQTNYIQRGVQVPAGEHFVEYRFAPLSFKLGVGITLASFFVGAYGLSRVPRSPP
jgi:uncharacterized membrane protein YqjE